MAEQLDTVYSHAAGRDALKDSWWSRYSASLVDFTPTAHDILERDCRYIVEKGVYGSTASVEVTDAERRVRSGLVMGSVQSGKTAAMLGSIAMSLDRDMDIVIVLAGTRLSLWQQTFDRLKSQLDQADDLFTKQRRRLLLPKTDPVSAATLQNRYQLTPVRVERALKAKQPIVIVALKHSGHLQALAQSLKQAFLPQVAKLERDVRMLIVDDEADDGSVLDARIEASMEPFDGHLKQIPRAIVDLWTPPGVKVPANLITTYVGFTATAQANLLQEDHNPLAPRDFLVALRTPFDQGELEKRSSTFAEPAGINRYYTGGETYYRRTQGAGLMVAVTGSDDEILGAAVRSFLVAGALQRLRNKERLGDLQARQARFTSLDEARALSPKPHSMLIHPSSLVEDQFMVAENVLMWSGLKTRAEARLVLAAGGSLPLVTIERLDFEEDLWRIWLDNYLSSSQEIGLEFNTMQSPPAPDWGAVREVLINEIIPGTRLAVINSDPEADDRPEYEPQEDNDGGWLAPRDISTIYVSGNVMARGLTLEGLTTTLFLRNSENPRADTQMQMQRWFGYRGSYIDLCRVFATKEQIQFFANYHDVDEALRRVVTEAMNNGVEAPGPMVLQGRGFLATGKIANLGTKPLHPGRKPFVSLINSSDERDPNANIVNDLFLHRQSADVNIAGRVRGRMLKTPLSITEAAGVLDQLRYRSYKPGRSSQLALLWSHIESRVNAIQPLGGGAVLYNAPGPDEGFDPSPVRKDCPYGIPAYLRLWSAASTRHIRGLFVTGERGQLWSMADLESKVAELPRFWVGIRYGASSSKVAGDSFAALPFDIRVTMKAVQGQTMEGTWGSNDPLADDSGYRGDEFFDYYYRGKSVAGLTLDKNVWRPQGDDGQILFYVNQGIEDKFPTIAVGICLPSGGPDQFAASLQAR